MITSRSGKWKCQGKGLAVGMCLASRRDRKEVVAGAESEELTVGGYCKGSGFFSEQVGNGPGLEPGVCDLPHVRTVFLDQERLPHRAAQARGQWCGQSWR